MAETALQKQCRVKTGVVTRLQKELDRYRADASTQSSKIDAMRVRGADEYDVKQQVEVLNETEIMIPDSLRRLERALAELRDFIASNGEDAGLAGSAQLTAATTLLAAVDAADAGGVHSSVGGSAAASSCAADDEAI